MNKHLPSTLLAGLAASLITLGPVPPTLGGQVRTEALTGSSSASPNPVIQRERVRTARREDSVLRYIARATSQATQWLRTTGRSLRGPARSARLSQIIQSVDENWVQLSEFLTNEYQAAEERLAQPGLGGDELIAFRGEAVFGLATADRVLTLVKRELRLASRLKPMDAGAKKYPLGTFRVYATDPMFPGFPQPVADVEILAHGKIKGQVHLDPLRARFNAAGAGSVFSLLGEHEAVGAARWLMGEGRGPSVDADWSQLRLSMLLSRVTLLAIDDALGYAPNGASDPDDSPAHQWAESCTLTWVPTR